MTVQEATKVLYSYADNLPGVYRVICEAAIEEMHRTQVPASRAYHHAYPGGLLVHTLEVLEYTLALSKGINRIPAAVAAILHDWKKTEEYAFTESGEIVATGYREMTGHIVGSVEAFIRELPTSWKNTPEVLMIKHAMLAHHGRKEYGSPVTPQTPLAWALHLADMMSAFAGEGK